MKYSAIGLIALALAATAPLFVGAATAETTVGSLFGNNMVLQRERPIPFWGWDAPGTTVTVSLGNAVAEARAGDDGKWITTLPAMDAGGPHTVTIKGSSEVKLANVLVGEVWLCSGQSNIAIHLDAEKYVNDSAAEVTAANYPNIRHVTIKLAATDAPKDRVALEGGWQECTPQTAAGFSAVGYFYGRMLYQELGVPIGLIGAYRHGSKIESWIPPEGYKSVPALKEIADNLAKYPRRNERGTLQAQDPLANYNGMIYPLVPYGMRGAIWYQGEANVGEGFIYHEKLKALIAGWRAVWHDATMPFYYVQLATCHHPFGPTALPEIWEAQLRTLTVPNTGMSVTTDIGHPTAVHPKNKQDVGKRLALWALAKTYGKKDLVYSGPLYKSMTVEGDKIRIAFDHVGGGLASLDGQPLDWFTIAGEDKVFVPAVAEVDGDTVVVGSEKVAKPVAVRFGWDHQAQPNLANKERLPASPFRTDGPTPRP